MRLGAYNIPPQNPAQSTQKAETPQTLQDIDTFLKTSGLETNGIDADGKDGVSYEELTKAKEWIDTLKRFQETKSQNPDLTSIETLSKSGETIKITSNLVTSINLSVETLELFSQLLNSSLELRKSIESTNSSFQVDLAYLQKTNTIRDNSLKKDDYEPSYISIDALESEVKKLSANGKPIILVVDGFDRIGTDINKDGRNDISHGGFIMELIHSGNPDCNIIGINVEMNDAGENIGRTNRVAILKDIQRIINLPEYKDRKPPIIQDLNLSHSNFSNMGSGLDITGIETILTNYAKETNSEPIAINRQNAEKIREILIDHFKKMTPDDMKTYFLDKGNKITVSEGALQTLQILTTVLHTPFYEFLNAEILESLEEGALIDKLGANGIQISKLSTNIHGNNVDPSTITCHPNVHIVAAQKESLDGTLDSGVSATHGLNNTPGFVTDIVTLPWMKIMYDGYDGDDNGSLDFPYTKFPIDTQSLPYQLTGRNAYSEKMIMHDKALLKDFLQDGGYSTNPKLISLQDNIDIILPHLPQYLRDEKLLQEEAKKHNIYILLEKGMKYNGIQFVSLDDQGYIQLAPETLKTEHRPTISRMPFGTSFAAPLLIKNLRQ